MMLKSILLLLSSLDDTYRTDLAWKEHITSVVKSLSSKIGLFLREQILKFDILCKLYFTLVVPHMDYCITIWGNSPSSHTDILPSISLKQIGKDHHKNYNCQLVVWILLSS